MGREFESGCGAMYVWCGGVWFWYFWRGVKTEKGSVGFRVLFEWQRDCGVESCAGGLERGRMYCSLTACWMFDGVMGV
jgi:hypothetical protein